MITDQITRLSLSQQLCDHTAGVDKTWGRSWPRPCCRPWPTLWPMAHPMAYRWSILLKLSSALLQTCVNNVLRQFVISMTLFRPLGGVSLKFSRQILGRLESRKPECCINTTFGELSHERGIIIKHLFANFRALRPVHSAQTGSQFLSLP